MMAKDGYKHEYDQDKNIAHQFLVWRCEKPQIR